MLKPTCRLLILGTSNTPFPSRQNPQASPNNGPTTELQLRCCHCPELLPRSAETVEGEDLLDEDSPAGS
ncbi:rCG30826 [Rattus norvegicus]|uniref:RCG30826 n=1 Tax=Rattus norvegicus TaxID=10116 RepID=A6ISZ0_RAT|nr:rCG30826 [Rattus norvegicus]